MLSLCALLFLLNSAAVIAFQRLSSLSLPTANKAVPVENARYADDVVQDSVCKVCVAALLSLLV